MNSNNKNYFGKQDDVVLVPYQEDYPLIYQQEKLLLEKFLSKSLFSIDHIGSTAIVGIKSKPIIDIGVSIEPFPLPKSVIEAITQAGYIYWDTNPNAYHHFFLKGMPRTHHLHIYPVGSEKLSNQLIFRNYLLEHDGLAKAYEQHKLALAHTFYNDQESYSEKKKDFIDRILNMAKVKG